VEQSATINQADGPSELVCSELLCESTGATPRERLDAPLMARVDTENVAQARELMIAPGDTVSFCKLGLSLIFDEGYWQLLDWLTTKGKKAFADIKAVRHSRNRRSLRQKAGRSQCLIRDGPRPREDDSCRRERPPGRDGTQAPLQ